MYIPTLQQCVTIKLSKSINVNTYIKHLQHRSFNSSKVINFRTKLSYARSMPLQQYDCHGGH